MVDCFVLVYNLGHISDVQINVLGREFGGNKIRGLGLRDLSRGHDASKFVDRGKAKTIVAKQSFPLNTTDVVSVARSLFARLAHRLVRE